MMILKCVIAILVFISTFTPSYSQADSCDLTVSVLTCGPGSDLYSIFGHTAIRVKSSDFDIIYNYGTFDFEDPDFYSKFVRGKLLYSVSADRFQQFMYEYQVENRSVEEQVLNMNCEERHRIFASLRENAKEENKYYRYQYLFDNCSTRPRDMVAKSFDDSVAFKRILPEPAPTLRDMIHEYLDRSHQYWSKFGIDLLLASRIDRQVTNLEAMFLPDYLLKGFDSAYANHKPVVTEKRMLLPQSAPPAETSWFTPLVFTMLLLAAGLMLTFIGNDSFKRAADIFDIGYFLILGLMGCFMLFMWFGTDHELCRDNYNVLWALPTHLAMAFFIFKKNNFVSKYFLATAVLCLLVLLSLRFLPQQIHPACLPLILLSGIRSFARYRKNKL